MRNAYSLGRGLKSLEIEEDGRRFNFEYDLDTT